MSDSRFASGYLMPQRSSMLLLQVLQRVVEKEKIGRGGELESIQKPTEPCIRNSH
jgi:hypothetical protein